MEELVITLSDESITSPQPKKLKGVESVNDDNIVISDDDKERLETKCNNSIILLLFGSISYYNENFPLYGKFDEVLKPTEVFDVILNTNIISEVVCNEKPVGVCDAAAFVVNITKLKHPNDLKADDMGSWVHKGKPVRYFNVDRSTDGKVLQATRCSKEESSSTIYKLTRIYYHHKGTSQFQKTLFMYMVCCNSTFIIPCNSSN